MDLAAAIGKNAALHGAPQRDYSAAKATIRVFYVYVRPGILRFFGKIDTTQL